MEEKIKQKNSTLYRHLFTVTTISKFLAMFLFILLPFEGFYLGMKYQERVSENTKIIANIQKAPTTKPTSFPTQSNSNIMPTTNPSLILNTTTSWKTYVNRQFGYSIGFPPGWYLDENDGSQPNAISIKNFLDSELTTEEKEIFLGAINRPTDKMYAILRVLDKKISDTSAIIDWLKTNDMYTIYGSDPISVKETTVAGYPGIILTYDMYKDEYYFRVGNMIFNSYIGPPTTSQTQNIFNQILSTFKFTK